MAIESDKLRQGLLTYALARDGLEAKLADWKPKDRQIELSEWLAYAEQRVPALYDEAKARNIQTVGRSRARALFVSVVDDKRLNRRRFQQPSLFDFRKAARPLILELVAP